MARVAVMGDTESIKGFAALGLDIFPCDREEEAAPLFRRLTAGGDTGVGIRRLSESVERAVGSDIIFGGKDRMGV